MLESFERGMTYDCRIQILLDDGGLVTGGLAIRKLGQNASCCGLDSGQISIKRCSNT